MFLIFPQKTVEKNDCICWERETCRKLFPSLAQTFHHTGPYIVVSNHLTHQKVKLLTNKQTTKQISKTAYLVIHGQIRGLVFITASLRNESTLMSSSHELIWLASLRVFYLPRVFLPSFISQHHVTILLNQETTENLMFL